MNGALRFLPWLPAFALLCCMEFDRFDRIDNDKLRVIAVRHEPHPDYAPGDTLVGKVYFAGEEVVWVGDFSIAYKQQYDKNSSFPDERPITLVDTTLWLPDSMQFRYALPEDVFLREQVHGTSDDAALKMVVDLMRSGQSMDALLLSGTIDQDSLMMLFSLLGGVYARPSLFFVARSTGGTSLKIRSETIVRYNSRLPDLLPVNRNPHLRWIAVYAVPNTMSATFTPFGNNDKAGIAPYYLYNEFEPDRVTDIIPIDTGFAYFVACNRGIDRYQTLSGEYLHDTTIDMLSMGAGVDAQPEQYEYRWFFQNVDVVDEIKDSLLLLNYNYSGPGYIQMKLPVVDEMKRFRLWVVVQDNVPGLWNRPKGYAVKAVEGRFTYSDAYIRSIKKR